MPDSCQIRRSTWGSKGEQQRDTLRNPDVVQAWTISRDRKIEPQRALRLALTEPEIVQIAPAQYRQAVDLLPSMIADFVERQSF